MNNQTPQFASYKNFLEKKSGNNLFSDDIKNKINKEDHNKKNDDIDNTLSPQLLEENLAKRYGELLSLHRSSAISTTKQYRASYEQQRIKFTNIILTRVRVIEVDRLSSNFEDRKPSGNDTILFDLDVQLDPDEFWFLWCHNSQTNVIAKSVSEVGISRRTDDSLRIPEPKGENNTPRNMVEQGTEFIIHRSYYTGAIIVSVPDGDVYEVKTDYEWITATLSPNNHRLAILCSEKSKRAIRVFDFRHPETIPHPELRLSDTPNIPGMNQYESTLKWKDDETLQVESKVYRKDRHAYGFDFYIESYRLKVKN